MYKIVAGQMYKTDNSGNTWKYNQRTGVFDENVTFKTHDSDYNIMLDLREDCYYKFDGEKRFKVMNSIKYPGHFDFGEYKSKTTNSEHTMTCEKEYLFTKPKILDGDKYEIDFYAFDKKTHVLKQCRTVQMNENQFKKFCNHKYYIGEKTETSEIKNEQTPLFQFLNEENITVSESINEKDWSNELFYGTDRIFMYPNKSNKNTHTFICPDRCLFSLPEYNVATKLYSVKFYSVSTNGRLVPCGTALMDESQVNDFMNKDFVPVINNRNSSQEVKEYAEIVSNKFEGLHSFTSNINKSIKYESFVIDTKKIPESGEYRISRDVGFKVPKFVKDDSYTIEMYRKDGDSYNPDLVLNISKEEMEKFIKDRFFVIDESPLINDKFFNDYVRSTSIDRLSINRNNSLANRLKSNEEYRELLNNFISNINTYIEKCKEFIETKRIDYQQLQKLHTDIKLLIDSKNFNQLFDNELIENFNKFNTISDNPKRYLDTIEEMEEILWKAKIVLNKNNTEELESIYSELKKHNHDNIKKMCNDIALIINNNNSIDDVLERIENLIGKLKNNETYKSYLSQIYDFVSSGNKYDIEGLQSVLNQVDPLPQALFNYINNHITTLYYNEDNNRRFIELLLDKTRDCKNNVEEEYKNLLNKCTIQQLKKIYNAFIHTGFNDFKLAINNINSENGNELPSDRVEDIFKKFEDLGTAKIKDITQSVLKSKLKKYPYLTLIYYTNRNRNENYEFKIIEEHKKLKDLYNKIKDIQNLILQVNEDKIKKIDDINKKYFDKYDEELKGIKQRINDDESIISQPCLLYKELNNWLKSEEVTYNKGIQRCIRKLMSDNRYSDRVQKVILDYEKTLLKKENNNELLDNIIKELKVKELCNKIIETPFRKEYGIEDLFNHLYQGSNISKPNSLLSKKYLELSNEFGNFTDDEKEVVKDEIFIQAGRAFNNKFKYTIMNNIQNLSNSKTDLYRLESFMKNCLEHLEGERFECDKDFDTVLKVYQQFLNYIKVNHMSKNTCLGMLKLLRRDERLLNEYIYTVTRKIEAIKTEQLNAWNSFITQLRNEQDMQLVKNFIEKKKEIDNNSNSNGTYKYSGHNYLTKLYSELKNKYGLNDEIKKYLDEMIGIKEGERLVKNNQIYEKLCNSINNIQELMIDSTNNQNSYFINGVQSMLKNNFNDKNAFKDRISWMLQNSNLQFKFSNIQINQISSYIYEYNIKNNNEFINLIQKKYNKLIMNLFDKALERWNDENRIDQIMDKIKKHDLELDSGGWYSTKYLPNDLNERLINKLQDKKQKIFSNIFDQAKKKIGYDKLIDDSLDSSFDNSINNMNKNLFTNKNTNINTNKTQTKTLIKNTYKKHI